MAQKPSRNEPTAMDNVKKGISLAAETASLKIKLSKTKSKRKTAFVRLGELTYAKHRPRANSVNEDIEKAISSTVQDITVLNHEITELELRIKLLKLAK